MDTMDHSMMDHGAMDHSGHGSLQMMEMMQMTFYASTNVTLLFDFWKTTNAGQLIGSCVVVCVMAFLYEGLKSFREILYSRAACGGSTTALMGGGAAAHWLTEMCRASHLIQTLLYGLQMTLSYALMLIFMSFNVYICVAVVFGASVGFLVFGWRKRLILDMSADHCG